MENIDERLKMLSNKIFDVRMKLGMLNPKEKEKCEGIILEELSVIKKEYAKCLRQKRESEIRGGKIK